MPLKIDSCRWCGRTGLRAKLFPRSVWTTRRHQFRVILDFYKVSRIIYQVKWKREMRVRAEIAPRLRFNSFGNWLRHLRHSHSSHALLFSFCEYRQSSSGWMRNENQFGQASLTIRLKLAEELIREWKRKSFSLFKLLPKQPKIPSQRRSLPNEKFDFVFHECRFNSDENIRCEKGKSSSFRKPKGK